MFFKILESRGGLSMRIYFRVCLIQNIQEAKTWCTCGMWVPGRLFWKFRDIPIRFGRWRSTTTEAVSSLVARFDHDSKLLKWNMLWMCPVSPNIEPCRTKSCAFSTRTAAKFCIKESDTKESNRKGIFPKLYVVVRNPKRVQGYFYTWWPCCDNRIHKTIRETVRAETSG